MLITPTQTFLLLLALPEPERTLTLLTCGTGLRISECLGLQWHDVRFDESLIRARHTWTCGMGRRAQEQGFTSSCTAALTASGLQLVGCRGNSDCSSTEVDAAFGYSHDDEHLRRRGHRRNGEGTLKSRRAGPESVA